MPVHEGTEGYATRAPVGKFALLTAALLFLAGSLLAAAGQPSSTAPCGSGAGAIPTDCSVGDAFVILELFLVGWAVLLVGTFAVLAERSQG